ncbi:zinc finger BED domain-containing protein RICESLEEPER 2-like [Mercurialis annua]|uniref:zinc finger BED domain-containing protein RICESLEEPER 2-like n=1 Tax=Mercurialis annua TaxID=3986 RepID=UPI0021605BD8|nr:zinc finger BED domain-containing protein RICESLEEPER 2-like [Mercurialis annua]
MILDFNLYMQLMRPKMDYQIFFFEEVDKFHFLIQICYVKSGGRKTLEMSNSEKNNADQLENDGVEGSAQPVQADTGTENAKILQGKKRKQIVSRSIVWDHFKRITDDDGKVISAKCLYCAKIYQSSTKLNGTSTLRAHMLACLKNPQSRDTRQALLTLQTTMNVPDVGEDEGIGKLGAWKFSQELIRNAVAFMIIVDELPIRFVEGIGFKKLMDIACPRFKIPSRWTVTRDCFQLYLDEKLKLKALLKNHSQRVSITSDSWTSIQRINYMCLTCHRLDDEWKLHKRILSFIPVTGHRGEYIAKSLENCLLEWGLKSIFTITMDNASSNDVAVSTFKKKLISWGTSVSKGRYLHMRCIAHILNLVVNDGLKDMHVSIKKVRDCVRYIRNSPARLKKFKDLATFVEIETKKCLSLDVPTRWNSTFLMLETASLYEKAFEKYDEEESSFRTDMQNNLPNSLDWEMIRKFSEYISDLHMVLIDMMDSEDIDVKNMGQKMKSKFDKYWGDPDKMNKLIFIAYVFDPSAKLDGMEYSLTSMFGDEKGSNLFQSVKCELALLFDEYKSMYETVVDGSNVCSQSNLNLREGVPSTISARVCGVKKPESLTKARFKKHRKEKGTLANKKSELEIYLSESLIEDDDNFDVLKWWKLNSERFPILSKMARDILAIPISTVASESAFSTGGRVLDCFRSSLTPRLAEALICAQDWLRASNLPLIVEESIDELELFEQGCIFSCRIMGLLLAENAAWTASFDAVFCFLGKEMVFFLGEIVKWSNFPSLGNKHDNFLVLMASILIINSVSGAYGSIFKILDSLHNLLNVPASDSTHNIDVFSYSCGSPDFELPVNLESGHSLCLEHFFDAYASTSLYVLDF